MKKATLISIIVSAVAVALIVAGLCAGEYMSVLMKAIVICLECIGIG